MTNEIDKVIFAEIPDPIIDKWVIWSCDQEHDTWICGAINTNSLCIINGKCSKRYPRKLLKDIITGNDGYPLYWRNIENNRKAINLKVRKNDVEVDNRWVDPYSPLIENS